jgi:hypothetical protein
MQSLCNQSVTRKMPWSVGRVAGIMIDAAGIQCHGWQVAFDSSFNR